MDSLENDPKRAEPRILLVEDDKVFAAVATQILRSFAEVQWEASAEAALAVLSNEDWDLVISDVNLPAMNGLEFARQARRICPFAAILILTGNANVETAIGALRADADDFLTKPLDATALTSKATEMIALTRTCKSKGRAVVLAIGAHPDDVEIGCAGALLRHAAHGDRVNILTLTGGESGGPVSERITESQRAAELLGARLFLSGLSDTSLSVSDGGVMIGAIETVIAETQPNIVYTHSCNDVHQDHRSVHHATLVAARRVPRVYCYQAPSANIDFRPTRFIGVDEWMERKLEVIDAYKTQVKIRSYLQADFLQATARYWSRFGTSRYAEPLEVIRDNEVTHDVSETSSAQPNTAEVQAHAS
jgi:LmbE family N-acetylglucosaminyl deacetylase/ActR/RegA family two-component response regulator